MIAPDQVNIDEAYIMTHIMPRIVKALKDFDGGAKVGEKKLKRPEFYDGYNEVCDIYEELKVHTDVKCFPAKLLGNRSPNMTEAEFTYIRDNYKPVTVPMWIDYINSVMKCWNDSGWAINWPDQDATGLYAGENSTRHYVESNLPGFKSLEQYFKYMLTKIVQADANGAIGIRPKNMRYDKDNGLFFEDDREVRRPEPIYYDCTRVIDPFHDDYFVVMAHEKSECKVGNKYERIGHIFEVYTKEFVLVVRQVGVFKDWQFETKVYIHHEIGKLPIRRNGGIPYLIKDKLCYLSPAQYAVGNLDLVILNASNLQLSINNVVYPVRVMVGAECDFEDKATGGRCVNGLIEVPNQQFHTKCTACHGTGLKSRLTPLGTMLIKPKQGLNNEGDIKPSDALYYVSPDVTSLEFLRDKIKEDEGRARSILHLKNSSDPSAGENVVESASNTEAHYAFIKPISDQIFDLFQWAIDIIGLYREGNAYKPAMVTSPINFEFYSEGDYLSQIQKAIQAQLPPFVVYTIVYKFLNTMFYTEHETAKRFHLIMAADMLLTLSDNAISMGEAKGVIAPWQILLHQSGINLIQELEAENEGLWDMELMDQVTALQDFAKKKYQENKAVDESEQMVQTKITALEVPEVESETTESE